MRMKTETLPLLCRWDDCFIRLLDGMLQVVGFTDKSLQDNMLKIPTRIRSITIAHPEGSSLAALPCTTERVLGTVSTPLATIVGLELSAAPRQAEPPGTRCRILSVSFPDKLQVHLLRQPFHEADIALACVRSGSQPSANPRQTEH